MFGLVLFTTVEHSKEDLGYSPKAIHFSIFFKNIWSYLLWSHVVSSMARVRPANTMMAHVQQYLLQMAMELQYIFI